MPWPIPIDALAVAGAVPAGQGCRRGGGSARRGLRVNHRGLSYRHGIPFSCGMVTVSCGMVTARPRAARCGRSRTMPGGSSPSAAWHNRYTRAARLERNG
jgi:hypothetical protein